MFKSFLACLNVGLLLTPIFPAFAASSVLEKKMQAEQANLSSQFVAELLKNINKSNSHVQFKGRVTKKDGFQLNKLMADLLVDFKADIEVPYMAKSSEKESQLDAVKPVMHLNTKGLLIGLSYYMKEKTTYIDLEFYDKNFKRGTEPQPKPMLVTLSNEFNASLMEISFGWLRIEIEQPKDPSKPKKITGTCSSQQPVLNFATGRADMVPLQCEFSGTYSADDYDIEFSYIDIDPSVVTGVKP